MSPSLIGSAGVGLLLLAYALNLLGRLHQRSEVYLAMNVLGSTMAAWYAWVGGSIPFVILEAVWAGVSVVQLFGIKRKGLR